MLRLRTYLAPSLPTSLFECLATHLAEQVGIDVDLTFDASRSGPRAGEVEPFTTGEVDFAFVCATSYVWMTTPPARAVELVGAAWAPTDPRVEGHARYFGDVLAPVGGPPELAELVGRRVAFNDDVSLSGYHSLRLAFGGAGVDPAAVEFVHSGSHLRSLDLLVAGEVDAAAIDSNVWRRRRRESPELEAALRPIATLGPHPTQPLVARRGLPPPLRRRARQVFLEAHEAPPVAAALNHAELRRFVAVGSTHYGGLRALMAGQAQDAGGRLRASEGNRRSMPAQ